MGLRLLELVIPDGERASLESFLETSDSLGTWYGSLEQGRLMVRILLHAQAAELVIDQLYDKFAKLDDFHLLVLSVEGALPRPEQGHVKDPAAPRSQRPGGQLLPRINREELYNEVIDSVNISWHQSSMVVLSTLIAAVGLLQDSQTVIIGAMVIAPLLKPNMALAVATALGDIALGVRTLWTGAAGIGLVVVLSAGIGYWFPVDPSLSEMAMRTDVQLPDVILALASGAAGALALTAGQTSAVVGVMVSVALLPPLVVFGLLMGSHQWPWLLGSGLLVLTNLVCLNLAAVLVMTLQDLGPRESYSADRAKQTTGVAIAGWGLLLAGLTTAISLWKFQVP